MNIKKLDKHNQHFKISPNVKLQRHFNDWDKRIKCNVHGLQKGKDYKINLQIKSKLKKVNFSQFEKIIFSEIFGL